MNPRLIAGLLLVLTTAGCAPALAGAALGQLMTTYISCRRSIQPHKTFDDCMHGGYDPRARDREIYDQLEFRRLEEHIRRER